MPTAGGRGALGTVAASLSGPKLATNLVGVPPLVVQQILALDPAGQVVAQTGHHDLPQVSHLALGRRLHLGVHEEPSFGAHGVDCGERLV